MLAFPSPKFLVIPCFGFGKKAVMKSEILCMQVCVVLAWACENQCEKSDTIICHASLSVAHDLPHMSTDA